MAIFIVGLIIIASTVMGFKKGLLRSVFSVVVIILALVLTNILYPMVSGKMHNSKRLNSRVSYEVGVRLNIDRNKKVNNKSQQQKVIDTLNVPDSFKKTLTDNNNSEVQKLFKADSFFDYIIDMCTYLIINGMAYLVTFLLVYVLIRFLLSIIKFVTDLPIIGFIDSMGGLLFGFAKGLFWVWVFFLAVNVLIHTDLGSGFYEQIANNPILRELYNHNLLESAMHNLAETLY